MNAFIQDLIEINRYQPNHLLHILRAVQAHYHYIPKAAIEQIADLLSISRTQIISVIEFYSFFSFDPPRTIRNFNQ
jgi:[NiFe] hydrogenase diaphorase moiety large subunit